MPRLRNLVFEHARGFELPHWLDRIVSAGIVTTDPQLARRQKITNLAAYGGAFNSASRFVAGFLHDYEHFVFVQTFSASFAIAAILIHRLHRFGDNAAAHALVVWFICSVTVAAVMFGLKSQVHFYFGLAGLLWFVFGVENWRQILVWLAILCVALLAIVAYVPQQGYALSIEGGPLNLLATQSMLNTIAVNSVLIAYALFLLRRAEGELERQSARNEALLSVVLPDAVAERLRAEPERRIADRIDDLSVLFADLAGFTPAAHGEPPETVVAYLDDLVTTLDTLCDAHGLEKIKTIGDAYMAVGGLQGRGRDAAVAMGRFALAVAAIKLAPLGGRTLALRIGINSGTAIAGVIGESRIAYDLWGDAVNVAARMESHGVPGRIHVSDAYRRMVEDVFLFEARGETEIKGIGVVKTYFLVGERQPTAVG